MTWTATDIALMLGKIVLLYAIILTGAAYLVLAERRILGFIQDRIGPNRVGPLGLLQPLADVIKMLTKEDMIPTAADRLLFSLAPAMAAIPAILTFAIIPLGAPVQLFGRQVHLQIADLNVGVLFFMALSSIAVYGVALGGWASNSKYALLGSIRGLSQLISYELSMGLSLVPVVMLAKSLSLADIVNAQAEMPFIVYQPVAFAIFLVSILAECRRIPFDLPEAEGELVAGFHTEYSGMRFGLFFVGEYINIISLGSLASLFFLGGWRGPLLPPVLWFFIKVGLFSFLFIWVRGTLPRLRYDQLMHLGWKFLTPLALLNILVTGWWLALR
ncbi:NADH-quinone oxidoreductase subunit NuoH [Geomonas sp. Red69]|uniref:NADH-quinone oxidoreductase subunit H n=1 Tax=Geomonas diazotrophica TaxID=2843197 RepID=A0ABX8JLL9_9BACT|nr:MULTISPECIES: NADH-quinone oxidoreductase subunit NuoH [Geomonas]MBU5635403.1 NADH-quinone oxidoreductase subunit NuoH [Geomonas diazotrophica]QWV97542.1 NADH-quinone oxidoreductase subunit NuoH [Geomonas nitrogeniifigens]QXE86682.1 NADH-quinone oxidoreductase subunit NuoH [Geomonas nitrogeniifigens]